MPPVPSHLCNVLSRVKPSRLLPALIFTLVLPAGLLAERPHLLVLVVFEQFRADYLELYRTGFSDNGFGRLLREGAVFPRCRFDHLVTLAAPNAAVLSTGAYPAHTGIVGNRWYHRAGQKVVDAVGEGTAEGISPRLLIGSTPADELKLASAGRSRVVTVSDNAAPVVLLAGRRPDACYWMDQEVRFTSAPYYGSETASWVEQFNRATPPLRHLGAAWKSVGADADTPPLRTLGSLDRKRFKEFLALYRASPFAVDDVFALARRAVEAENLGEGSYTDLLIVHVGAPASLARETGAFSPLMRDMVLRLDGALGGFLDHLDEQVGLDRVSLVFTALHGIPPSPETARAAGLPAAPVSGEDVVAAVNRALAEKFGPDLFVEKYIYPSVYLNGKTAVAPERREVIEAAGQAAVEVEGVAGYFLPGLGGVPADLRPAFERSLHAGRSGDLLLVYEPYFIEDFAEGRGTSSGSPYPYDTDVPLIFFGKGFRSGRFNEQADAASIAPTISAVLEIAAPSLARAPVLHQALRRGEEESALAGPPAPNSSCPTSKHPFAASR